MDEHKPNLRILFTIGLISSLSVLAGSIIAPIEVRYIESFTNDSMVAGSVFGVASIFFVLLSYWVGRISDVYGRRRTIMVGLFFGVVYSLLYATVFNLLQIYGVKFAWAVSAVATGPVLAAYLQDFLETTASKGRYFGYVYSAQAASGSVGALVGGYAAEQYGLETPFLILAGVYVLILLITFLFLPSQRKDLSHRGQVPQGRSLFTTLRFIVSKPELRFYLTVNIGFGINWGIKAFLWPLLIFDLAQSDFVTGSVFATMGFVAFLLLPVAGRFVDHFGPQRIMLFELLILGLTGIGLAFAESITLFWVLAAIYTVGEVLNGPAQGVLLTENVDSHLRGEVMGLDAILDQVLMVAAPFVAGTLIAIVGLQMTFLCFMLFYWVSLCVGLLQYRTARPAA